MGLVVGLDVGSDGGCSGGCSVAGKLVEFIKMPALLG